MTGGSTNRHIPEFRNISEVVAENAATSEDKPWVIDAETCNSISHGQLHQICRRIAAFLRHEGVGVGDTVVVLSQNSIEEAALHVAVMNYGAVLCPVNTTVGEKNLEQVLATLAPRMILWNSGYGHTEELKALVPGVSLHEYCPWDGSDETFIVPDSGTVDPTDEVLNVLPSDRAVVIFTSGTTGTPKGVVHTFESYYYLGCAGIELTSMTREDRILEFRALTWLSPQGLSLAASLLSGGTLILAKTFSRSRYFAWVSTHGATIAVCVPTALNMLMSEPVDFHASATPQLRYLTSSTAALTVERQLEFEELYGIEILTMYGMSESGWMAGNRHGNRRLGTVGFPSATQEMRLLDEAGNLCAPGEPGEIVTGGLQAAWGYLLGAGEEAPLADRHAIATGDLGTFDAEGYLSIVGRRKEIIIRGGVNIAPAEINEAILKHPAVADAATVGVDDPIYGEEVVSFVSLRSEVAADDLMVHCADLVSEYKLPKEIVILDSLPYSDRGKVTAAALKEIWARRSSVDV